MVFDKDMAQLINFPNPWITWGSILLNFWPYLLALIFMAIISIAVQRKTVRYFIRENQLEFLTAFFTLAGYVVSYYFIQQPDRSFFFNAALLLVAMIIFVSLKTKERDFYFIPLKRAKDREDWIGEGIFQYERTHDAYSITNSSSGFIFPKCLIWSDYKLEFHFKILKTSLGVILRATNLSNLVMLKISDTGIKTHIRINGLWQSYDQLDFKKRIDLDDWYLCSIHCDKSLIRIGIDEWVERVDPEDSSKVITETNRVFDRTWKIPSGHISPEMKDAPIMQKLTIQYVSFPINLEYGTFGFCNDGTENALVRDVLVEKI